MARKCSCCHLECPSSLVCSSCCVAPYCGKKCQAADYRHHKAVCLQISSLRKIKDEMKEEIRRRFDETGWRAARAGFLQTREGTMYCAVIHKLGLLYMEVGETEDNMLAFEAALKLFTELMVLSPTTHRLIRPLLPFVLISMGRLQACYGFLKRWATAEIEPKDASPSSGNSSDGDSSADEQVQRFFAKDADYLEDLAVDPRVRGVNSLETSLLLALVVLKTAVIEELRRGAGKKHRRGGQGSVRRTIEKQIGEQEKMLRRYCMALQRANHHLLTFIAAPDALDDDLLSIYLRGSVEEATVLATISRHACEMTGAKVKVTQMLHTMPEAVMRADGDVGLLVSPLATLKKPFRGREGDESNVAAAGNDIPELRAEIST